MGATRAHWVAISIDTVLRFEIVLVGLLGDSRVLSLQSARAVAVLASRSSSLITAPSLSSSALLPIGGPSSPPQVTIYHLWVLPSQCAQKVYCLVGVGELLSQDLDLAFQIGNLLSFGILILHGLIRDKRRLGGIVER